MGLVIELCAEFHVVLASAVANSIRILEGANAVRLGQVVAPRAAKPRKTGEADLWKAGSELSLFVSGDACHLIEVRSRQYCAEEKVVAIVSQAELVEPFRAEDASPCKGHTLRSAVQVLYA